MRVPLLDLTRQYADLADSIEPEVQRLCRSQQFILGPEVERFETELAAHTGAAHCVGVSSGTDGQLALLMAMGLGAGDAVVTTPFTFFATAGCLHRLGIEILFADIDPETFNLDPQAVERLLNQLRYRNGSLWSERGNQVRCLLPVHLFGQCADMTAINQLAARFELDVIEDSAQAIGAFYGGQQAGAMGRASWFSFFPSKNLGAFGDAGAVTCQEPDLAERIRAIRNHGMTAPYTHTGVGGNFRLDALQALVLRKKLPHLNRWTELRRAHASYYNQQWEERAIQDRVCGPRIAHESSFGPAHIYHQYVIRSRHRDALKAHLDERGIGNAIYYPTPLHQQPCFASLGYGAGACPVSEQASREVLALPVFPELTEEERHAVVEEVVGFFG